MSTHQANLMQYSKSFRFLCKPFYAPCYEMFCILIGKVVEILNIRGMLSQSLNGKIEQSKKKSIEIEPRGVYINSNVKKSEFLFSCNIAFFTCCTHCLAVSKHISIYVICKNCLASYSGKLTRL